MKISFKLLPCPSPSTIGYSSRLFDEGAKKTGIERWIFHQVRGNLAGEILGAFLKTVIDVASDIVERSVVTNQVTIDHRTKRGDQTDLHILAVPFSIRLRTKTYLTSELVV